MERFLCN